jgi:predicted nuclease of predicted toxin-antitoxin system
MRILLDECVNPRLRLAFPGVEVKTVAEIGWRSLTNGRLLREAAANHFARNQAK